MKFWLFCVFIYLPCYSSAKDFSREESTAIGHLIENISPAGSVAGVVVASPSKKDPDYYFHWVRDASITMERIVDLYANSLPGAQRSKYFNLLTDFIYFSRRNQLTPSISGDVGEPKFHVNGAAYDGPWGRPQNDGPALRAIILTKLAWVWLAEGKTSLVRELLYEPQLPAYRVVKADLEYTSHHWKDHCYDIWEEVRGEHFFTLMVQRRALKEGAKLALLMEDPKAADWYAGQAALIEMNLVKHWEAKKKVILPTLYRDEGADYKSSGLDSSVILGSLLGRTNDFFFSPSDDRMLATAILLEETFRDLYPINKKGIGISIGRYPEDRYDGILTNTQGNPWYLLTSAFAEFYYTAAKEFQARQKIVISNVNYTFFQAVLGNGISVGQVLASDSFLFKSTLSKLKTKGDDFLQRVSQYSSDGHMSEQIHRLTGNKQGAPDLTWSYGAYLSALAAR